MGENAPPEVVGGRGVLECPYVVGECSRFALGWVRESTFVVVVAGLEPCRRDSYVRLGGGRCGDVTLVNNIRDEAFIIEWAGGGGNAVAGVSFGVWYGGRDLLRVGGGDDLS